MHQMKINAKELVPINFEGVLKSATKNEHIEFLLGGGRGSCKSSSVSVFIILLVIMTQNVNAIVLRKYQNTLRESVYAQLQWAIFKLGLEHLFKFSKTPLQIEYRPTGQKILFRGCDDPVKVKSIKADKGYIGILWFEEFSEYSPEEVRSIKQSIMRGGDKFWVFESYNPPVSASNWVNEYALSIDPKRLTHFSDYRTVNKEWLGEVFIYEAEKLKEQNERLYNHEYLGIATGTGLNIFENIEVRAITDEEINGLEWHYHGIDWGYFPDPFAYGSMAYDAKHKHLYIYKELYLYKASNWDASETLKEIVDQNNRVTADSAEPKSIADFRQWGWNITGAVKGKGSLDYGFKWLQSLDKIIIDPARCPKALKEFTGYEYEQSRNGDILSGYPQGQDDHYLALTRYAMESVWKKRGM